MTFPRTITCPIPNTLTPLSPNGYRLSIQKLPDLEFFCQEVNLPTVGLGEFKQPTPLANIYVPGDKLEFGTLDLEFLVDYQMKNYMSIFNWLKGLGFPTDNEDYNKFVRDSYKASNASSDTITNYSDGTLSILSPTNNPLKEVYFVDMFPTALSSITFNSTSPDVQYVAGKVSFRYTTFDFR